MNTDGQDEKIHRKIVADPIGFNKLMPREQNSTIAKRASRRPMTAVVFQEEAKPHWTATEKPGSLETGWGASIPKKLVVKQKEIP